MRPPLMASLVVASAALGTGTVLRQENWSGQAAPRRDTCSRARTDRDDAGQLGTVRRRQPRAIAVLKTDAKVVATGANGVSRLYLAAHLANPQLPDPVVYHQVAAVLAVPPALIGFDDSTDNVDAASADRMLCSSVPLLILAPSCTSDRSAPVNAGKPGRWT